MNARFLAVLAVPAIAAVAAVVMYVLLTDGDDAGGPRVPPFREVVYESIDAPPISLDHALDLIRQDEVFLIILQPDTYDGGAERWYRYTEDDEILQWRVEGIDVLLYAGRADSVLAIATSETSVGVTELQLETIYDTIRGADLTSRIQIRDDREWWANGKPLPYEEVIVDLDSDSQ